jgi:hypothetical protein
MNHKTAWSNTGDKGDERDLLNRLLACVGHTAQPARAASLDLPLDIIHKLSVPLQAHQGQPAAPQGPRRGHTRHHRGSPAVQHTCQLVAPHTAAASHPVAVGQERLGLGSHLEPSLRKITTSPHRPSARGAERTSLIWLYLTCTSRFSTGELVVTINLQQRQHEQYGCRECEGGM